MFVLIQYSRKSFIILSILAAFIFLIIVGIMTEGKPITPDKLKYLSGWTALDTSAEKEHSYFPADKQSYILTMTHDLTEEMSGKVISFRTNDSYVDVYLLTQNGKSKEELYHFGEQLSFGDSPGTYTHFIDIPHNASGQVMIRIETVYKNKFLMEYDVAIGSKNELIYGYLQSEAFSVIPNILLIIFGLILFIIYIVSLGMHRPVLEALSLSILTIIFTI